MKNAKVTIEEYNEELHGYCDDCDYVLTIPSLELPLIELAGLVADRMGYNYMVNRYSFDGVGYLFLCHA